MLKSILIINLLVATSAFAGLTTPSILGGGSGSGGGGSPTGAAGGSLTGTYPNPGVNAAKLTGVVPFANGGFNQSLGTNWVPAGAQYDNGSVNPFGDPQYLVTLKAGVAVQVQLNGDGNYQGLASQDENVIYVNQFGGSFTPPTNGQYIIIGQNPGASVVASIYATTNTVPIPAIVEIYTLTLDNALSIANGGTGTNSSAGFPSLFGTQNIGSYSVGVWTVNNSFTPSYRGQVLTANGGGTAQPTDLMISTGTGAGQFTNAVDFPYGVNIIGNPSYMQPGRAFLAVYVLGNPIDQTNASYDSGIRLWPCDPFSSGAGYTMPWTGTNANLGTTGGPWDNWPTSVITNAAGVKDYAHDRLASAIMTVPDASIEADSPNMTIWVNNGFATFGQTNIRPMQALMVNNPGNGLTGGNYPALLVNPTAASVDIGWWFDKAWGYMSNNYRFSARFDLYTGIVEIPNSLNTSNLVVTNTSTLTGGIVGVTGASSAASGIVGEFIESVVPNSGPTNYTSATATNLTSISLTAGDWDVEASVINLGAVATITFQQCDISTISKTVNASRCNTDGSTYTTFTGLKYLPLTRRQINVSTTTTVYLVSQVTFTGTSVTGYGYINARRIR